MAVLPARQDSRSTKSAANRRAEAQKAAAASVFVAQSLVREQMLQAKRVGTRAKNFSKKVVAARTKAATAGGFVMPDSDRPAFTASAERLAELTVNTSARYPFKFKPGDNKKNMNLAMPHRVSWMDIRDLTRVAFDDKSGMYDDFFMAWTEAFIRAGDDYIIKSKAKADKHEFGMEKPGRTRSSQGKADLRAKADLHILSQKEFVRARDNFIKNKTDLTRADFEIAANSFHANVPDYGPHAGVNASVQEHFHSNFSFRKNINFPGTPDPVTFHASQILSFFSSVATDRSGSPIETTGGTRAISAIADGTVASRFAAALKQVIAGYNSATKSG